MDWVNEVARIVLSIFFIFNGANHVLNLNTMTAYAKSKSVPFPKAAVAVTGVALLAGGLSHLFLYNVVAGSVVVAAFLVLAAVMVHRFWVEKDEGQKANEMAHFLKNLAVAAATLLSAGSLS